MTMNHIELDGESLTTSRLICLAKTNMRIVISDRSWQVVAKARQVVEQVLDRGDAVYGLTTGLGARVGERLTTKELTDFSYQMLRGRAHAIGPPLSKAHVRTALVLRLNSLLTGMAGASPSLVQHLMDCLNFDAIPVVGEIGSIGVSDLCLGATMGMALIGEGDMMDGQGKIRPSGDVMASVGLQPAELGPKDGLVLANHCGFSVARGVIALHSATVCLELLQKAAAMTMEAFRANLSPLDSILRQRNPQPGHRRAAEQLSALLQGSVLNNPKQARNLQDPLSVRNVVQVHGAAFAAVQYAGEMIEPELNASSDNPAVDLTQRKIISCGAYYTPHITLAVETVSRSILQSAMVQIARMSKLLSTRFSDLPLFLVKPTSISNGFAPCMKIAESVVAEIAQRAMPVAPWPSVNADGTEDVMSNTMMAARTLEEISGLLMRLIALEMMMASQALECRGLGDHMASGVAEQYDMVRRIVPPLQEDRPMSRDIEALVGHLQSTVGSSR